MSVLFFASRLMTLQAPTALKAPFAFDYLAWNLLLFGLIEDSELNVLIFMSLNATVNMRFKGLIVMILIVL